MEIELVSREPQVLSKVRKKILTGNPRPGGSDRTTLEHGVFSELISQVADTSGGKLLSRDAAGAV